ncbi:unnamed protein product [Amoebophrya sp. A120]|nr:unnamed protein product [Amoebophrya sp. A120]|eukprot:GSA120T00004699001.1
MEPTVPTSSGAAVVLPQAQPAPADGAPPLLAAASTSAYPTPRTKLANEVVSDLLEPFHGKHEEVTDQLQVSTPRGEGGVAAAAAQREQAQIDQMQQMYDEENEVNISAFFSETAAAAQQLGELQGRANIVPGPLKLAGAGTTPPFILQQVGAGGGSSSTTPRTAISAAAGGGGGGPPPNTEEEQMLSDSTSGALSGSKRVSFSQQDLDQADLRQRSRSAGSGRVGLGQQGTSMSSPSSKAARALAKGDIAGYLSSIRGKERSVFNGLSQVGRLPAGAGAASSRKVGVAGKQQMNKSPQQRAQQSRPEGEAQQQEQDLVFLQQGGGDLRDDDVNDNEFTEQMEQQMLADEQYDEYEVAAPSPSCRKLFDQLVQQKIHYPTKLKSKKLKTDHDHPYLSRGVNVLWCKPEYDSKKTVGLGWSQTMGREKPPKGRGSAALVPSMSNNFAGAPGVVGMNTAGTSRQSYNNTNFSSNSAQLRQLSNAFSRGGSATSSSTGTNRAASISASIQALQSGRFLTPCGTKNVLGCRATTGGHQHPQNNSAVVWDLKTFPLPGALADLIELDEVAVKITLNTTLNTAVSTSKTGAGTSTCLVADSTSSRLLLRTTTTSANYTTSGSSRPGSAPTGGGGLYGKATAQLADQSSTDDVLMGILDENKSNKEVDGDDVFVLQLTSNVREDDTAPSSSTSGFLAGGRNKPPTTSSSSMVRGKPSSQMSHLNKDAIRIRCLNREEFIREDEGGVYVLTPLETRATCFSLKSVFSSGGGAAARGSAGGAPEREVEEVSMDRTKLLQYPWSCRSIVVVVQSGMHDKFLFDEMTFVMQFLRATILLRCICNTGERRCRDWSRCWRRRK